MPDPLDVHWPGVGAHHLEIMAESYRLVAANTWLDIPNETRIRLLDMADVIERRAGDADA